MKSRHGSRIRLLCRTCGRTFCSRRGSDQFASLISEGMSCASLARTLHMCPATISRWLARAAKHARAFGEEHDRVDVPTELQLDEISARPASQPRSPWIFNALEVGSRYWASAVVGRRTRRSTRKFVLRVRTACASIPTGLVIISDPFPYYLREIERTFGPTCTYVHSKTDSVAALSIAYSLAIQAIASPASTGSLLSASSNLRRTCAQQATCTTRAGSSAAS
jgi:hypothetical protein